MLSEKSRSLLRSAGKKLISVSLIFIGAILLVDISFRPIVEKVNYYECTAVLTELINAAVTDELQREDIDYRKLVELSTNSDGELVSVESNVANINRLKTSISSRLDRDLQRLSAVEISIPVGTLIGVQMLHGKGFDVGMSVQPLGYASTAIISEFTEAGINQTRHRIVIQITAKADAIIPGFTTDVKVTTSIVAAETIIIGRVPEAYTRVVSGDSDLVGNLIDFKAESD